MCATIISMASEMLTRSLKALADPTRLQIIGFLRDCCCTRAEVNDEGGVISPTAGEVCCHITGAEKVTSTISHHLHELEDAGLVTLERRGKTTVCRLRPEGLIETADAIRALAEGGEENVCC